MIERRGKIIAIREVPESRTLTWRYITVKWNDGEIESFVEEE